MFFGTGTRIAKDCAAQGTRRTAARASRRPSRAEESLRGASGRRVSVRVRARGPRRNPLGRSRRRDTKDGRLGPPLRDLPADRLEIPIQEPPRLDLDLADALARDAPALADLLERLGAPLLVVFPPFVAAEVVVSLRASWNCPSWNLGPSSGGLPDSCLNGCRDMCVDSTQPTGGHQESERSRTSASANELSCGLCGRSPSPRGWAFVAQLGVCRRASAASRHAPIRLP